MQMDTSAIKIDWFGSETHELVHMLHKAAVVGIESSVCVLGGCVQSSGCKTWPLGRPINKVSNS